MEVVEMNRLEKSIRRLYLEFADVPRPDHIDGCPCCIDDKNVSNLLNTKLAEISQEDLSPYAESAFLTVGSLADYLYFLPRILELTAKEDHFWPDPEITGRSIATAKLESWPAARREALLEFLEAVIELAIKDGKSHQIDQWMCAIGRMKIDVRPYLLRIAGSPEAVLGYFEENSDRLTKGRLSNPFWELPCQGHDAIVAWFRSEPIRRIPFDAYGFEF
jgi:hypothetical protein